MKATTVTVELVGGPFDGGEKLIRSTTVMFVQPMDSMYNAVYLVGSEGKCAFFSHIVSVST